MDTGSEVAPAIYNADDGLFWRFPNYVDGDRCLSYYYSGVLYWEPFPEPKRGGGFVAEPELPFPAPDITVPLTLEERAQVAILGYLTDGGLHQGPPYIPASEVVEKLNKATIQNATD